MENNLEIHRENVHKFMHTLSPGCSYLIIIAHPNDPETVIVSSSFGKEDLLELLEDLLESFVEGTAIEKKVTVKSK